MNLVKVIVVPIVLLSVMCGIVCMKGRLKGMEFQKLIEKRRTVRKYAEGNTVTKEDILAMVKAA